ncbi:ribonuclease P protein subunit p14-like [Uloborus diversus]|uniref:ribonuclease P protein subunit p14-like n=1 Tax=Uloborus diversus TaxID=327109 RepID=UPI00240A984C|nr:ribonuclease P protein subunit p14-like [Uloborus diversus]
MSSPKSLELRQSSNFYMDIRLDFGEEYGNSAVEMDEKLFRYAISLALKILYGDMGYIIPVDVLKYREEDRRALIRLPARELVKVWSALSLFSKYDDLDCMFRIYKVTPVLACLNLNSRLYEHLTVEGCREK